MTKPICSVVVPLVVDAIVSWTIANTLSATVVASVPNGTRVVDQDDQLGNPSKRNTAVISYAL